MASCASGRSINWWKVGCSHSDWQTLHFWAIKIQIDKVLFLLAPFVYEYHNHKFVLHSFYSDYGREIEREGKKKKRRREHRKPRPVGPCRPHTIREFDFFFFFKTFTWCSNLPVLLHELACIITFDTVTRVRGVYITRGEIVSLAFLLSAYSRLSKLLSSYEMCSTELLCAQ